MSHGGVFPLVIELGYRRLTLDEVDRNALDGDDGRYEPIEERVLIARDLTGPHRLCIIIHELLHAIYDARQLRDRDHEERVVQAVSSGLTELLMRNAGLRAVLKDLFTREVGTF